ncbi:restriction endonuclease subunit S [Streptomyces thermogriseus]|uniref:Type I restriction modification DNA specificity domain-containing protein n=1 Tax=Streptomyces thermogriseus TaxID=75292 RepID=A0ABN1STA0_9ACTN
MSEGGNPSELPKGWVQVRLDEIAEVRLGRQRSPKNHSGTQMRPYLRAANVDWNGLKLDDVKEMNFTDDEVAVYGLKKGDILLSEASGSVSEVGKPAIWNDEIADCCFQNTLIRVRSYGVDPGYLLHFLRSEAIRGAFVKHSRGVGIHHLGAARLAAWQVPVPPLGEQRRIVVALDEQLSHLASGTETLRGALTKAGALRRKILASLTTPSSSGWTEHQLGDLATTVRNGMYVSRPGIEPDGVPILRIGAVRPLQLDLSDLRYSAVEVQRVAEDGYLLDQGDLLFTRYNGNPAYVGACAVVPEGTGALTYPDKLIRVQLRQDIADPEFVAMVCTGGPARRVIQAAVKTTAGQAGIAGKDLKKVPIWLPSLDEQRERARAYRDWEETISRLEAEISKGESHSDRLRRSLLAEAFAGRLVPQDPADEPAEALLDRIRAEREAAGVTKSRRRSPRRAPAQRRRTPDTAPTPDAPPPPRADAPALATATQPTLDLEIPS